MARLRTVQSAFSRFPWSSIGERFIYLIYTIDTVTLSPSVSQCLSAYYYQHCCIEGGLHLYPLPPRPDNIGYWKSQSCVPLPTDNQTLTSGKFWSLWHQEHKLVYLSTTCLDVSKRAWWTVSESRTENWQHLHIVFRTKCWTNELIFPSVRQRWLPTSTHVP